MIRNNDVTWILIIHFLVTGSNYVDAEIEGKTDCGNGVRSDSCSECKRSGEPEEWCGGDCRWDNLFDECKPKLDDKWWTSN